MNKLNKKWLFSLFFTVIALPLVSASFGSSASITESATYAVVQITCTDGQGYSCYPINYSINGGAWQHAYGADTNFTIIEDGNSEVRYYAVGWNCTGEKCSYAVEPMNYAWAYVIGDVTPPFTTFTSPSGWQTQDFNVALSCDDFNGAGCGATRYRLDLGPWNAFGSTVPAWWDSNWSYRRKVIFDNNNQAQKTNYSVLLRLNSSNFDFSKVQSAGQDIRFRDSNQGSALDYFFDEFNSALQIATIWVKVPIIDANSVSDYVWMYYGNPNASDAQSSNWFG